VIFQNPWLFKVADGRVASAQLYADTAAVRPAAA
jgi:ketosteroid isomerase-like protein